VTGARGARGDKELRVLFLPDFSASNPYQRRLADALGRLGVTVSMRRAPRRDPLPILRAWLLQRRPQIVHLHWTHNYLGMSAEGDGDGRAAGPSRLATARFVFEVRLLRLLGVRTVWTVHNLGHHEGSPAAAREASAHRALVMASGAVICHCHAAEAAVADSYGLPRRVRTKLRVIPHGNYIGAYGPPVERADARRRLELPEDATVFLFLGAVRGYKGVAELIGAFRSLADPQARLVIAGKPHTAELAAELEGAAAADSRIELQLRFVPDADVAVLLGAADAVVAPFRAILTSGSVILAMSYGRAVVAPALGCLPEVVDANGGVLYEARDPSGLAEALVKAADSDLDAMGRHNLRAAQALDWMPIAAATKELYMDIDVA
jgi:glycosyltransferase involved in cell wall biosynthesis